MASEFVSAREGSLLAARLAGAEPHVSGADAEICKKRGIAYMESPNSLISSVGSAMTGVRPFAFLKSYEKLSEISFMRMPVASVTFDSHDKFLSLLNSGCIMFSAASNQELIDTVIQAYAISEDRKVLLPSVIHHDDAGFKEGVSLPGDKVISNFVGGFSLPHKLDIKNPAALGSPINEGYGKLKMQQAKAMENALGVSTKVFEYWAKRFRRSYNGIETYQTADAEMILITMGMHYATAKKAVDALREKGAKAGLVRIRMLRPFPYNELSEAVKNTSVIGTADFSVAPGSRGILQREVGSSISFMILKRPSVKDYADMFNKMKEGAKTYWVVQ